MIDRVLDREVGRKPNGGYTNDPIDRGKETKWGLSKRTYPALDIKNLTRAQAVVVYYRDFLHGPRIDRILDLTLREQVFDFGVHSSVPRAVRYLQELVSVDADGVVGPLTLGAVNAYTGPNAAFLNNRLVDARLAFLTRIVENGPKQARFERGWRKRAASFRL